MKQTEMEQLAAAWWRGWMLSKDRDTFNQWWIACEMVLINQGAPPLLWTPKEHKHGT